MITTLLHLLRLFPFLCGGHRQLAIESHREPRVAPAAGRVQEDEEVPRAGVLLKQAYQRTRWRNGRVFVWLSVRKQTGRGEGSSGLAFDRIIDTRLSR